MMYVNHCQSIISCFQHIKTYEIHKTPCLHAMQRKHYNTLSWYCQYIVNILRVR